MCAVVHARRAARRVSSPTAGGSLDSESTLPAGLDPTELPPQRPLPSAVLAIARGYPALLAALEEMLRRRVPRGKGQRCGETTRSARDVARRARTHVVSHPFPEASTIGTASARDPRRPRAASETKRKRRRGALTTRADGSFPGVNELRPPSPPVPFSYPCL